MTKARTLSATVLVLCGGLLAACGSTSSSPGTSAPTATSTGVSTTSTTATGVTTTTTSGGPRNLTVTSADKAALTAAFVTAKKVAAGDITGTQPGTVYYAYVPATQTYWALATFVPSATAQQQTLVGMQDGGATGIFSRSAGGSWTMVGVGSFPFCPSQTPIPPAVQAVWGLTDPTGCSTSG